MEQSKQIPGYSWLTVRVPDEGTPGQPVYDGGIDMVLTASDRTRAALAATELERQRRERNRADDARDLGVALEQLE